MSDPDHGPIFRPYITLGSIGLMVTILMGVGGLIYKIGVVQATLEGGITREGELREVQNKAIRDNLEIVRGDLRDLRGVVLRTRARGD